MKIAICSDIHLEFGALPIENTENADVLVLAGDICVAEDFFKKDIRKRYLNFFEQCSKQFKHVIYIMGNHEHYAGDIGNSYHILKKIVGEYPNVKILENETFEVDDVVFVCQTLWTDLNGDDPNTKLKLRAYMNDYRIIRILHENDTDLSVLSPDDTLSIHKKSVEHIVNTAKNNPDKKVVVVGHHAPSHKSVKPRYELDYEVNGGYRSNLEWVMDQHRNIKLWIHGHTHHEFDYMIHDTRVVCNPRGYVNYERKSQQEQPYYPVVVDLDFVGDSVVFSGSRDSLSPTLDNGRKDCFDDF